MTFYRAKVASYGDKLDQKKTSSDNRIKRENTVSELEFNFEDNTDMDAFAFQYPPRKEHIDGRKGGIKTSK